MGEPAGEDGVAQRSATWLWPAVLGAGLLFTAAVRLQTPLYVFDGGIFAGMWQFTGPDRLPYRDLWHPYGPGVALLGMTVGGLFGDGLFVMWLTLYLLTCALAVAVYLLARRWVHDAVAVTFALFVATVAAPAYHFLIAELAIMLGLICFFSADKSRRRGLWLTLGAASVGSAFVGRYELAVVSVLILATVAWRLELSSRERLWLLTAGAVPLAAFGIFLLVGVGPARAWENLVVFPSGHYALPECRGLPTPWGTALAGLWAPLRKGWWADSDLVLFLGTWVAPLAGAATLAVGVTRTRRRRDSDAAALLVIGMTTVLLWLAMRPRNGVYPVPVIPFLVVALAASAALGRRVTRWAAGVLAVVIASVLLWSWAPAGARAWVDWPAFDPMYGFADYDREPTYEPETMRQLAVVIDQYAEPGEPILTALTDNSGTFATPAVVYWATGHPPATRYWDANPCLTDRPDIQRRVVADLDRQQTPVVVTTPLFQIPPPLDPASDVLDEYLAARYEQVWSSDDDRFRVLVRR